VIPIAAIVAAIAVVTALGGFNDVPESKLPLVQLGDSVDGEEIRASVTSIYLSPTRPMSDLDAEAGIQYLVVEATLENTTTRPNIFQYDVVRVALDGVIEPTAQTEALIELRTGQQVSFLQSGMSTEVAYVWQVDAADAAPGDEIFAGIFDRYKVANDPIFGDTAYTAPTPIARISTEIGVAP
jgi:hypothetical protein